MAGGVSTLCGAEPERCSPDQRRALGSNALDGPESRRVRLEIRRAYRCPCDGESDRWTGPVEPARQLACDAEREAAEVCTDTASATCPWAGYFDPDVRLVRWAHAFWPHLVEGLGDEPEMWLVEAVAYYHSAFEAAVIRVRESMRRPMGVQETERGGKIRG